MSFYKDFNDKIAVERWTTTVREPYSSITVSQLNPIIGAEVSGLSLRDELTTNQIDEVRRVLIFRNQELSTEDHIRFAKVFGTPHKHVLANNTALDAGSNYPEVFAWKTARSSRYTSGDGWHADVTCDENPISASLLRVTKLPANGGGDTAFANMYLAYEFLSDPIKLLLEGLTAVHDGALAWGYVSESSTTSKSYPKNEHPVIPRHPETGKKFLFVNPGFTSHIVELTRPESDALLQFLYSHIAQTLAIQTRFHWTPNSLLIWDNWATQHHAIWDYYPEERWAERVSVYGSNRPQR